MIQQSFLEEAFEKLLNYSEPSRSFTILATYLGLCFILINTIRFLLASATGFRLYFIAQISGFQVDFVKRYGKWALVTGATDGIGLSIAKELASRGMSILAVGRNATKLQRTKSMLEAIPNVGEVETVLIDQSDPSSKNYERIRSQVKPERRDIGILVNNAGVYPDTAQRVNNFDMDYLISLVNVNILGQVHMVRMLMPGMIQRGKGMVLNVSSVSNFTNLPYAGLYIPSKTFVSAFTRQLQIEYAPHPIDIVLLTPGPVLTNTLEAASNMSKANPFNPAPDDYARTAVNALSARCKQYSGTIVHGLLHLAFLYGDYIGVLRYMWLAGLKMGARNFHLSPVPRRKALANQSAA